MDRIDEEISLLKKVAGGRSTIKRGTTTISEVRFSSILIENVRLSSEKFNVTSTDVLLLLPSQYPRIPPIGCYLNYKWSTIDEHFTLMSHYGAPQLQGKGWYWYCVGLGGGFSQTSWSRSWLPKVPASLGHNLSTIFVTARYAINND